MKKINEFFSNKIFKFIFRLIRFVVYGTLITYVAFILTQRFTNNSSIMGYRIFNIATGSMIPVYKVNDIILVKEVDVNTLKVGDDVAYIGTRGGFENKIITHRIIKIEENNYGGLVFFTKGINTSTEDPSITGDQIIGKVEYKIPVINQLNHIVKSNAGFFFIIFCPLVLVIGLEIAQSVIEIKLDNNEIKEIESNKKKKKKEKVDENIDKKEEIEVKEEKEVKVESKEEEKIEQLEEIEELEELEEIKVKVELKEEEEEIEIL